MPQGCRGKRPASRRTRQYPNWCRIQNQQFETYDQGAEAEYNRASDEDFVQDTKMVEHGICHFDAPLPHQPLCNQKVPATSSHWLSSLNRTAGDFSETVCPTWIRARRRLANNLLSDGLKRRACSSGQVRSPMPKKVRAINLNFGTISGTGCCPYVRPSRRTGGSNVQAD